MGNPSISECMDTGDTAWVLISAVLVLGMMPGLAFFEAGLLRRKSALSILTQVFAGLVVLQLLWYIFGFSVVFDGDYAGLIGGYRYCLYWNLGQECIPQAAHVPGLAWATFQSMFAVITPLLMTGAIAERIRFKMFIVLIVLWEVIVYYPVAHWIWGGGWLSRLGVLDFAGGIVIHATSGSSSIVLALALGRRKGFAKYHGEFPPHNVPLAMIGGALLWMGWYGFNAGSAGAANQVATYAVSTTTMAACSSCVVWVVLSMLKEGHVSPIALLNGFIAGLAGVTPASGYIQSYWAALLGIVLGLVSWYGIIIIKGYLHVDDALDVSSVHGLTGIVGAYSIAIFKDTSVNSYGGDGLLNGDPSLLWIQLVGILVAVAWAVMWTTLFCVVAHFVPVLRLRVTDEHEQLGWDKSKGLQAYLDLHSRENTVEHGSTYSEYDESDRLTHGSPNLLVVPQINVESSPSSSSSRSKSSKRYDGSNDWGIIDQSLESSV